jgi:isoleucyl-tRNA synthetase
MDFHAEAVIAEEFMKFVMNGSLYQGSKPVMWSPVEKTALAEAEVEYREHQSHQVWVPFKVVAGAPPHLDAARVVIWTTTPWTIPQNRAVAFNPDLAYGVYEVTGRPEASLAVIGARYLLADASPKAC